MGRAIYAIGDIHGQRAMLDDALALIEADGGRDAPVVMVGDLVDRGPDSRGVIERLIAGRAAGRDWTVLCGNHDRMFLRFLDRGAVHDANIVSGIGWLNRPLGGASTLASYSIAGGERRGAVDLHEEARQAVPASHRDFLAALPCWHRQGDLLFVHAGIRPGIPLERQSEDDMLWIREPFLNWTDPHPWTIVHGHTSLPAPKAYANRINIDGGAGHGRALVPVVLEAGRAWALTRRGRKAL